MAHPVRRHSNARQGNRRSHWNLQMPTLNDETGSALEAPRTRRHFVSADGYYRGRKVVDIKPKKAKEEK